MSNDKKLILKTSLITVAGVALAALIVFSMWILISPQTMASAAEKTGNYSFAVTCADLRYSYTKADEDLARCTDDSILSGKDKLVIKYGEKLLALKDFDGVCAARGENYKSFVCANIAVSQYRLKDLDTAIKTADLAGTEEGYIKLTLEVLNGNNQEEKQQLKNELKDKYSDLANLL